MGSREKRERGRWGGDPDGLTAPACLCCGGTGDGAGVHQLVETPWPLVSAKKGYQTKKKPPEETKIRGGTRAGEEEARRRGTRGQELKTRPSSVTTGTRPQVKDGREGEGFKDMAEEGRT